LDLFCGAGGAAMGYHRAGFDVTGVDLAPQRRYPFRFVQADALEYLAEHGHRFAAKHASPPCQDWSTSKSTWNATPHGTAHLLPDTRAALIASGGPWIIENVPGADMRTDFRLCGCMFNLPRLRRERWFETSWRGFELRPPCTHRGKAITVTGNGGNSSYGKTWRTDRGSRLERHAAMGIDWMTAVELSQAIPPAYTEHLGRLLMDQVRHAAPSASREQAGGADNVRPPNENGGPLQGTAATSY
jgi:DNA (cytosine-5)-methyltransferase 1